MSNQTDIEILESECKNVQISEEDEENIIEMKTKELLRKRQKELEMSEKQYIQPLFTKPHSSNDPATSMFQDIAYQRFLKERYSQLEKAHGFIDKIIKIRNGITEKEKNYVSYKEFCDLFADDKVDPIYSLFLKASSFIHFPRRPDGKISLEFFHYYVTEKCKLIEFQTILMYYAREEIGYISEVEFEQFVTDHVVKYFEGLRELPERMHVFYIHHTVRKFLFFLDSNHKGKISLDSLWKSSLLKELLQINEPVDDQLQINNWFSPHKALAIYQKYLELDKDRDGMLSQEELQLYGALTPAFIQRVFECSHIFDGKMDYKSFLDFAIAMENKDTKEGIAYFFRLLDINSVGYLTSFNINYFFKEINSFLSAHELDTVPVEDVRDEIFDMVHPADPLKIKLKDLIESKCGKTLVNMLIDGNEFWKYDNRESLMQSEEET